MFCIHGEQEGCVSQIAHIDLAVFQENDVLVFLPLQRFRQQGAQADDFFPLKRLHTPVAGIVQKGSRFSLQHEHIRHVFHAPLDLDRPGDGMLPEEFLLAQIQLECKGKAGAWYMNDLSKIQSHSTLLTWYRGYCSKKISACQILSSNFLQNMVYWWTVRHKTSLGRTHFPFDSR